MLRRLRMEQVGICVCVCVVSERQLLIFIVFRISVRSHTTRPQKLYPYPKGSKGPNN